MYTYIYGFVSVCAHIYIHRYREDIQARVCLRVLLSVWMDSDNLDLHIDIMCARSMTVDKFYTDVGIPHFILHSRGNDLVTSLLPPIQYVFGTPSHPLESPYLGWHSNSTTAV